MFLFCSKDHPDRNIDIIIVIAEITRMMFEYISLLKYYDKPPKVCVSDIRIRMADAE